MPNFIGLGKLGSFFLSLSSPDRETPINAQASTNGNRDFVVLVCIPVSPNDVRAEYDQSKSWPISQTRGYAESRNYFFISAYFGAISCNNFKFKRLLSHLECQVLSGSKVDIGLRFFRQAASLHAGARG